MRFRGGVASLVLAGVFLLAGSPQPASALWRDSVHFDAGVVELAEVGIAGVGSPTATRGGAAFDLVSDALHPGDSLTIVFPVQVRVSGTTMRPVIEVQGWTAPEGLVTVSVSHPPFFPSLGTQTILVTLELAVSPGVGESPAAIDLTDLAVVLDSHRTWTSTATVDLGTLIVDAPGSPDGPEVPIDPSRPVQCDTTFGGLLLAISADGPWGACADLGIVSVPDASHRQHTAATLYVRAQPAGNIYSLMADSSQSVPADVIENVGTAGSPALVAGTDYVHSVSFVVGFSHAFVTAVRGGGNGDFMVAVKDTANGSIVGYLYGTLTVGSGTPTRAAAVPSPAPAGPASLDTVLDGAVDDPVPASSDGDQGEPESAELREEGAVPEGRREQEPVIDEEVPDA